MGNKQQWISFDEMPEIIFGAEDDDQGDASGDSDESSSDSSSDENGVAGSSSNDSSGADEHDDANDDVTKGLRSALAAERKANKDREKELKTLRKAKDDRDLSEKDEVEQANTKAERATARADKLAAGLLKRDVDSAIRTAAEAAGFIDVSDALDGVDRSLLSIDQDEDDPTVITLDDKAVALLVKNLGIKKPHFLKKGTDDGEPSGSQFGRRSNRKQTDDEAYKESYPSLR